MSKRKQLSKEQELRRQVEILKAQIRVDTPRAASVVRDAVSGVKPVEHTERTELPIKTIRRDLLRTTLYAVFALVTLGVLSQINLLQLLAKIPFKLQ